jgi:hypothetical protein
VNGDAYYELPWVAECPTCGAAMYEPSCEVCIEADYMDERDAA